MRVERCLREGTRRGALRHAPCPHLPCRQTRSQTHPVGKRARRGEHMHASVPNSVTNPPVTSRFRSARRTSSCAPSLTWQRAFTAGSRVRLSRCLLCNRHGTPSARFRIRLDAWHSLWHASAHHGAPRRRCSLSNPTRRMARRCLGRGDLGRRDLGRGVEHRSAWIHASEWIHRAHHGAHRAPRRVPSQPRLRRGADLDLPHDLLRRGADLDLPHDLRPRAHEGARTRGCRRRHEATAVQ